MRTTLRAPWALLLVLGALSGCSGNNPASSVPAAGSATSDDQAQVVTALAAEPGVVEDGISDSQDLVTAGPATGNAAIQPLDWWRRFTARGRRFEFAFADTDSTGRPRFARVTIYTRLQGQFNIAVGPPPSDNPMALAGDQVIHKRLDELRVRRVLLRRVRGPEGPVWRVVAVSGIEVSSKDHTTRIVTLRVQSGPQDTTLTNPLVALKPGNVMQFPPDVDVHLTATTERSDDVLVLHLGGLRYRMHNNGDNTYSATFRTPLPQRGLIHFGVDALSHGTLFDDAAPYDSQRWVLPFVIAPEVFGEDLSS